ncbi:hypothetical protein KJ975_09360 [Myxococcota bacterium]|nr:hypothetical protein [Myxococcota bacterium]
MKTPSVANQYAAIGLNSVGRCLSMMDRNPLSPTYGCANREYWLARSTDFPSAIAQYGILPMALAYSEPFENNIYYKQPKIAAWVAAGMSYLSSIQHKDGSFDEFYPNERGWAGPTGFLLHAMVAGWKAVAPLLDVQDKERISTTMLRAAKFLASNDEVGVLANHHAMALLPIAETMELFKAYHLEPLYEERKKVFLDVCYDEGWCLEYDGVDPGYLSATVTFLARLDQARPDPVLLDVAKKAIDFTKYFVYPDGHYGGTLGSRETFHFYSHGYEVLGHENPMALAQADFMLKSYAAGKSVTPHLQSDRYFVYRIPEFLFSARDAAPRPEVLPALPWQENNNQQFLFPEAGIWGGRRGNYYAIANLARGGVFKCFRLNDNGEEGGIPLASDCSMSGIMPDGTVFTTAWCDPDRNFEAHGVEANVHARGLELHTQTFDPLKMTVFRAGMLALGWHQKSAYHLKGLIRKVLMLRNTTVPVQLHRHMKLSPEGFVVTDRITVAKGTRLQRLILGEELPVRYVPQSRYFQPLELQVSGRELTPSELDQLKGQGEITFQRVLS